MTQKKIALVTGALSGIGLATAELLAERGYRLVVSGRRQDAGQQLEQRLRQINPDVRYKNANMDSEQEIRDLVAFTTGEFGGLDIAINAAGIEGVKQSAADITVENYLAVFNTNVLGVMLAMKYQIPVMVARQSGSIVNVSSILGHRGMAGSLVYAASKHAVEGMTKSAALEVAAQGVRINAVAPGPVDTPMLDRFVEKDASAKEAFISSLPARRAATAQEIARTILFVADGGAEMLIGQSVTVDSGFSA